MYYLALAILCWVLTPFLLDWALLPRLLPFAFVGGWLDGVMDFVGDWTGWWRYQDTWPLQGHDTISILIHFSAAPVLTMFFAQGLRPNSRLPWLNALAKMKPTPWLYICAFSLFSMVPELLAAPIGRILYLPPWNPYLSFAVYLVMWWAVYRLDRYWQRTGLL